VVLTTSVRGDKTGGSYRRMPPIGVEPISADPNESLEEAEEQET
jgi:hypothetical protein